MEKVFMKRFTSLMLRDLAGDAGLVKLVVLGLFGLMINVGWAQPTNDSFASAAVLTGYSGTINGTNIGASLETCESNSVPTDDNGTVTNDNSVWYQWTAPVSGPVEFTTIGSSFDTVLAVYTTTNGLCDPNLTFVTADDNSGQVSDPNFSPTSLSSFSAVAGTTYYISVNGNAFPETTDSGSLVLSWNYNDNFANATVITGPSGTTNGYNVGMTLDGCELPFINYDDFADLDNSVWFSWTAPSGGTAEFDTIGSDFDTVLAVYTTPTDDCDPSSVQIAGNDNISATQTNSQVSFPVVAGTTYYISVNGNADVGPPFDSGNYMLNWSVGNAPTVSSGTFRLASSTIQGGLPTY